MWSGVGHVWNRRVGGGKYGHLQILDKGWDAAQYYSAEEKV